MYISAGHLSAGGREVVAWALQHIDYLIEIERRRFLDPRATQISMKYNIRLKVVPTVSSPICTTECGSQLDSERANRRSFTAGYVFLLKYELHGEALYLPFLAD
jgi:hypothetical protein